jgi:phage head maturation protease
MTDDQQRSEESPMIETRSANVDDVDFGQRIITVCAVPYEQPAQVFYKRELWNEVFTRTAFDGIEGRQKRIPVTSCLQVPDINHGQGHIVGRVLEAFPNREEGLITDLKISRTERGDETLELARDEALSVSVGFLVKDPYRDEILDRRSKTRRVNRAFLDHLAFVGQPAYPGAKVLAMRSDGMPEADFPPAERPLLDEFVGDPVFQWASQRIQGS